MPELLTRCDGVPVVSDCLPQCRATVPRTDRQADPSILTTADQTKHPYKDTSSVIKNHRHSSALPRTYQQGAEGPSEIWRHALGRLLPISWLNMAGNMVDGYYQPASRPAHRPGPPASLPASPPANPRTWQVPCGNLLAKGLVSHNIISCRSLKEAGGRAGRREG